jgi:predicted  nucleic acid-binding Zn-ribbon protein
MNPDLELLIKLQDIDHRAYELNQSKKEFPVEVASMNETIKKAQDSVAALEKKIAIIQAERTTVEDKIQQASAALDKSETRLSSITTNREYDAVHAEIEAQKHLVANGGSRLKNFDLDIETHTKQLEEAEAVLETLKTESQPRIDELNAKIASIDSDVAEVLKEREVIIPQIERSALRHYEYIHKRRPNAKIIAQISSTNRACSICNKILEPQFINEIHRGLTIETCQACGSILAWKESTPEAEDISPA